MTPVEKHTKMIAVYNNTKAKEHSIVNALDTEHWDVERAIRRVKKERDIMRKTVSERKLILHLHEGVDEVNAIEGVKKVVEQGLIAAKGTSYKYVSNFENGIKVISTKGTYGHKFHVSKWK